MTFQLIDSLLLHVLGNNLFSPVCFINCFIFHGVDLFADCVNGFIPHRTIRQLQIAMMLQNLSDAQILLTCSTSPSVEAPDFVENERRYLHAFCGFNSLT